MKPKEYLNQIKFLDIRINDKLAEREALWSLATKVTPTLSKAKVSGGSENDKIGNIVAKIVALDEEINNKIDEFIDFRNVIIKQIENIRDVRYQSLLKKRYVEYKDLSVIAAEMNYEYATILKLHGKALQMFEEEYMR